MEQCKNKSLRSSGLRSKNGFSIRNKMKKNESRWMNSLPFTLVAKNKNLSKSLYGLSVPITKVYNDVPFISLKNTAYVSFDYENFCHTDIDISKLIKFKKPSTIPTRYKSQSEPPNNEQPLMQLGINLKRIQLTDLLKSKLSQGSRKYVESLLPKLESIKMTETASKTNTVHKFSNLTIEIYNSNSINDSDSNVNNDKAENEITNTKNNSTASQAKAIKLCQNLINETRTNEDILGIKRPSRSTSTQNHDSLINDFEIRGEIDNSNNKIMNKDVLLTISNLNPNLDPNESRKLKRSLSKQQLISSKNSNKRFRSIGDCEHSYQNLEISTSNITNLTISANQPNNQVIKESKTSKITYNEFIAKNKKIQYERKLLGKTNTARNNNASSNKLKNTNEIEIIDLTI